MMTQNHIIAGFVVSQVVANPLIGIPLAFASHFLLDLFPHPTSEMGIRFQSPLKITRDRVTLAFMSSFGILVTVMFCLLIFKRGFDWYVLACLISANFMDLWWQAWPLLTFGDRSKIREDHLFILVKNPYFNIVINQVVSLAGIIYLI